MRPTSLATMTILLAAAPLSAQVSEAPAPIQDNSFLIEEAYNQEPGVVQHISTFADARGDGGWLYTFTQEWPLFSQRHQLSFTLPVARVQAGLDEQTGIGDLMVNYRYQLVGSGQTRVAVSPRVTAILPTGDEEKGLGAGRAGAQVNLPVSVVIAPQWVAHTNAGATWLPSAETGLGDQPSETALSAGQSLVWLAHPRVNFLVEAVVNHTMSGGDDETEVLVSPGVRFAIDGPGGAQIVPGLAVPLGVGPSGGERLLFLYLSIEHAFTRRR
jgi:Putative MetA-pathway of phenol degradation